jgi:tRNA dimethylallyltransferase
MDIGTAKPTLAEQGGIPHHLIDIADPDEILSLAAFQELALQAIGDIAGRGRLPLLVGGTGQYIQAVVQGWQAPPIAPQPRLRAVLEAWAAQIGAAGLHARLAVLDAQAAAAIQPRNLRRTVRALEVIFVTGEKFSTQRQAAPGPYQVLQLGLELPRPELYARIDARIEAMLNAGFLEEARTLLARGYDPGLPTLSAIGYAEMIACLRGELSREAAVAQIKRRTRIFVRRQANWFKRDDPQIHWFQAGPGAVEAMEAEARAWLAGRAALRRNSPA